MNTNDRGGHGGGGHKIGGHDDGGHGTKLFIFMYTFKYKAQPPSVNSFSGVVLMT